MVTANEHHIHAFRKMPTCPFNTLCEDEIICPIFQESPVNIEDVKKEIDLALSMSAIKPTLAKQTR